MPITKFDPEEEKLLEPYVTSTTANVFALKNLQGIVGPAFARYSRAKGGVRDVLLKEFIKDGIMDPVHANELIARILIQYGDDSVGELEGAHLSFEQISVLQTKDIEDRRIGGSPIEQSTRYVFYDQKDTNGNWLYYRGSELIHSSFGKQYAETMDFIFQTYSDLIEPLKNYLETQKPISEAEYDIDGDGTKEKWEDLKDEKSQKSFRLTYTMDLRTKACDVLRALLPLSTKTNLGLFGNGRYYQEMLSYLMTTDLPESNKNAGLAKEALDQIIPQYVKRAARKEYNVANNKAMFNLAQELLGNIENQIPEQLPNYVLSDRGENYIEQQIKSGESLKEAMSEFEYISMLASMLYSYSNLSLAKLRELVVNFDDSIKQKIWNTYLGNRDNRRNRPGRALENGYPYTFDLITNFGVYKDLERHRMNTQQRQMFTTKLGWDIPDEIKQIQAEEKWEACFKKSDELFDVMANESPLLAQYAVLHGHYVRWLLGINDRAIMHLLELRSTPQGHPQYRAASQEIHKLIMERDKRRGEAMSHVDYGDYYWSRADSEAKQRAKEAKLDSEK